MTNKINAQNITSILNSDVFTCPELPLFLEESWRRTDPEMFFTPPSDVICPDGKSISENCSVSKNSPWKINFQKISPSAFLEKFSAHFKTDESCEPLPTALLLEINDVSVTITEQQVAQDNTKGSSLDSRIQISSSLLSHNTSLINSLELNAVAPNVEGRSLIGAKLSARLEKICGFSLNLNLKKCTPQQQVYIVVNSHPQFAQSHLILNVVAEQNSHWNVGMRQYGSNQNHFQYRFKLEEGSQLGSFFHVNQNHDILNTTSHSENTSNDSISLTERVVVLQKNTKLTDGIVAIPTGEHRFINNIVLAGEGSHAECATTILNSGYAHFDYEPIHEHIAPLGKAQLHSHYVANESSKTYFQGFVVVEKNAVKSDSVQINKNLILGKNAVVDSLPRLKILPHEVSCKHGSASGQLDKQSLYYLNTRGFSENKAKKMLTLSFACEPFTKHLSQSENSTFQFVQNLGVAHVASNMLEE
jgi:Fe-S cluster assembly protein SufD